MSEKCVVCYGGGCKHCASEAPQKERVPLNGLLPCPFCGWEADGPFDEWEEGYTIICCTNMACAAEIKLPQPSVFAITAWNGRVR